MKTYLIAQSLWDVVETDNNLKLTQIRNHNDEVTKQGRALSILHVTLSDDIFIKILNVEIAKESWGKPKEEYHGSERTKNMKVLNFRREFETVRKFSDKILKVVTQFRLLREDLSDQRVVEFFIGVSSRDV